jgi:hypothetical protein
MKRFSLLVLAIPLLSIASMAQSPGPSEEPSPSPSINQAVALSSPGPTPESKGGLPSLPWVVEMFASGVMLISVIGVLWIVIRTYADLKYSIGARHIQFVSVCLIVPTILILGLEKVLTSETSATLIGGLAGYLLSNIGKHDPENGKGGQPDKNSDASGKPGNSKSKPPRGDEASEENPNVVFGAGSEG